MKKVLIIEDNFDNRENSAEILELANYEVITAENGFRGVDLAISEKPDLIMCDIKMPDMDGYDVLHLLTLNEETAIIPFVFVSAKAEKCEIIKGMLLGANDYIIKPFDSTILLDVIEMNFKKSPVFYNEYSTDINVINKLISNSKGVKMLQEIADKENLNNRFDKKKDIIYMNGIYPKGIYLLSDGSYLSYKTNGYHKELISEKYLEDDFILPPRIVKRCAIY